MNNFSSNKHFNATCGAMAILLFIYLVFRNAGLHAVVMADEWYYSSFARLTPLKDANVPSYLYLLLSQSTRSCGTGFLECARLLNVVVFLCAAPLIYSIGRRFLTPGLAAMVAFCALAGPINSYTAYFMPEAMYFTGFWLLSLAAFRFREQPTGRRAAAFGIALGMMSLIKVHGLFLLPACVLFIATCGPLTSGAKKNGALGRTLACIALLLAAATATRLGAGYLLAGKNGLHLLGTLYANQATHSGGQHTPLIQLLQLAMINLRGHLMGLALLFGMPIAATLSYFGTLRNAAAWQRPATALTLYTAFMLLSLLAMTVLFTASIAGSGQESNFRLHMRYYSFCFPLLLLIGATKLQTDAPVGPRSLRVILAVIVTGAIVYATLTLWRPYTPSLVDSPELEGMTAWRQGFYAMSALSVAGVLTWAWKPRWGSLVYFGMFMPVFLIIAGYAINHQVERGGGSNQFDRAGAFARQYLTPQELAHLAIVTDDGSGMFKAQFYADEARIVQHMAPQGSVIDKNALPPATEWILFIGKYAAPEGALVRVQSRGFSLVELSPQSADHFSVDFSKPDGGMLAHSQGLSGIESWGRWSDGDSVKLDFQQSLPKKFKLGVLVEAFGPNAGQMATFAVGNEVRHARIDKAKKLLEFEFINPGDSKSLVITVPYPTSPHDLNGSEDRRRIGIGMSRLTIDELP
jgi:phosphoglycerol transferase